MEVGYLPQSLWIDAPRQLERASIYTASISTPQHRRGMIPGMLRKC